MLFLLPSVGEQILNIIITIEIFIKINYVLFFKYPIGHLLLILFFFVIKSIIFDKKK